MKNLGILIGIIAVIVIAINLMPSKGNKLDEFLHFNNGAEPKTLDPHVSTGIPESHIIDALYEGLITLDQETLAIKPGAAESWSISEDGKTYTFKLGNRKWSNGDPLTAQDFADSWHRILKLDPVSEYVTFPFDIAGAEEFANNKEATDFSQVGVKVVDDNTLEVTLRNKVPFFLEKLAHHSMFAVHNAKASMQDGKFISDNTMFRAGKLVGNGAFTLKYWSDKDKIIVEKNPHYWDAANVNLKGVVFYPIEQMDTALMMFRKGKLDVMDDISIESIPQLKKDNDPALKIHPYLGIYYYRFNVTQKPFNDVRVRKAICHAVDKVRITDSVTMGGELPANAMCPPGMPGYTSPEGLAYNVQKAKALLKDAGYPNGEGFPEITLLYNTSENHKKIALSIGQMLEQNLGIKINLQNKEWSVYLDDMSNLNYSMARSGWIGDYSDPHTFLSLMMSDDGNNRTGWKNKTFDEYIRMSLEANDDTVRRTNMAQAEKILVEDEVPVMPIYYYVSKNMVGPRVKGWKLNIRNHHPWKDLSLDLPQQ